ncbi:hypothetical protein M438DRAFT_347462 [Aureobasidium pullulans EXF-150]|uniref:Uncharacterized protein n=1 Tax=Aureobasidium pullulans EXF-150 TaxID=1043002 RepID=A0A074Y5N0_AURPU|nr:uncharacterized protein M438DRAFT_347462 [Aureobasidium pullulans EXF-150]KEQ82196.1 hypothetical protein M438DRAFT_347462 [Aureobasidium pullulans EXF-150]
MNSHALSYIFALTPSVNLAFTCFFRTPFTSITNILPNPRLFPSLPTNASSLGLPVVQNLLSLL